LEVFGTDLEGEGFPWRRAEAVAIADEPHDASLLPH
jgi:hypothetical protein